MSLISVKKLTKCYKEHRALKGVSFDVRHGEIFALLGPNGSGKTTTMEILMGLKSFDGGNVCFSDENGEQQSKLNIGPVFQTPVYYESLTVKELIKYYRSFYKRVSVNIDKYLDLMNLDDKLDCLYKNLSGGQKQQLSILLSLVNEPDVLFFDEPSNALDPQIRLKIWELIRTLKQDGKTIVFTTHYIEEAEALADRVAILNKGEILVTDTPQRIIQNYNEQYLVELVLDDTATIDDLAGVGVVNPQHEQGVFSFSVPAIDSNVLQLIDRLSDRFQIAKFSIGKSSLEDVFVRLTDEGGLV